MGSGGAEKFVSMILPKLTNDFEVYLFLVYNIKHFDIPANVKVVTFSSDGNIGILNKILLFPKVIIRYNRFIRKNKIDISLSLLTRPNIINTIVKTFNRKLKVIISERCFPSIAYKSNKFRYALYQFILPLAYNRADIIFSNSIHINNDLRRNFNINSDMKVIYNPIQPAKQDYTKEIKSFDIIWIGKLISIKNPSMLIDALKITQDKYRVQFLGAGNLENDLKESSNLEICYRGNVNNVFDYIKESKCLILTSDSEGFPNVILEGMAYGLPVISTNCTSGPLEILNDNVPVDILQGEYMIVKYGILVNVKDSIALSKAIDRLLSDKELYQELSKMSLSRAKNYSVDTIYNELFYLLQ